MGWINSKNCVKVGVLQSVCVSARLQLRQEPYDSIENANYACGIWKCAVLNAERNVCMRHSESPINFLLLFIILLFHSQCICEYCSNSIQPNCENRTHKTHIHGRTLSYCQSHSPNSGPNHLQSQNWLWEGTTSSSTSAQHAVWLYGGRGYTQPGFRVAFTA